jgi:Peptidase family M23
MASENQTDRASQPPFGVPIRLWLALLAACTVAANLLDDALFDELVIAAYFCGGIATVAGLRFRARQAEAGSKRSVSWEVCLAVMQGAFLGWLLLLYTLLVWYSAEILSRGTLGEPALWCARLGLAVFFGALLLLLLKRRRDRVWEFARRAVMGLLATVVGGALIYSVFFTGPLDMEAYPAASDSPYQLPWKPGIRRLCVQSNHNIASHNGSSTYAYDFYMPVGTEICAARAGRVARVVDDHDGNGISAKGNFVTILHDDRTYAVYGHIRQGGSLVRVGQRVKQGDVICESGNVGYSLSPHLHFHVGRGDETIPVSFADVAGDGIPRGLRRYTSGP